MQPLELLLRQGLVAGTEGSKDLVATITGRFYTPETIGRALAKTVALSSNINAKAVVRCVDPFCGDGRLVSWLLEEHANATTSRAEWRIQLWDCDASATERAKQTVTATARRLGIRAQVKCMCVDSFQFALDSKGKFDVVITNPPWEALKPDRRYLRVLDDRARQDYVERIRAQALTLGELYPLSRPAESFTSWRSNLSRYGTELALGLLEDSGTCGLVSPATLMGDQVSERLRQHLFKKFHVSEIAFYPAESRLFVGVDQPCITLVATATAPKKFETRIRHGMNGSPVNSLKLSWQRLEEWKYSIPVYLGPQQIRLLSKLSALPKFNHLESEVTSGLWAGRELDETGIDGRLAPTGHLGFLKGRMVSRFKFEQPTRFIARNATRIPPSVKYSRLAWRDVSRQTQKRRMIATIIPPGIITGNSLGVAHFRNGDVSRLKVLLGLVSSLIFEIQIRAFLGTAHISLSAIRQARVVPLMELAKKNLISLVEVALEGGDTAPLERLVAKGYGLSRNDFITVIEAFPKLTDSEREILASKKKWGSA